MTTIYNLVDNYDGGRLATFRTSLTLKELKSIREKTDIEYTENNEFKTTIFFEMIDKEDKDFEELDVKEIEI